MGRWIRVVAFGAIAAAGASFAEAAASPDAVELALRAEDHVRAERLARARLAEAERGSGRDSAAALQALDSVVDVLLDGERLDTPDLPALLEREERLARALAGAHSPALARALTCKAIWLALHRDYPEFVRTVEAVPVGHGEDPSTAVENGLQRGFILYYLERDTAGGEARLRALLETTAGGAPDPRMRCKVLRMHARMLLDSQRIDEAVRAMRDYEAYARREFGRRSARRSDALTWLGYALRESGQYAAGIDALREGADIAAQLRPYRQRLHVDALNALAQNLAIVGDADKARVEFERALAIEERHPSANGYLLGLLLNSLGTLHGERGDPAAASAHFARALPIYARVFGPTSPKMLVTENNYAQALQDLGSLDEAAAVYRRIIAANEAEPNPKAGAIAWSPYRNLALVYLWQRRYAESEALFRRYLRLLGEGQDFGEINPRSAAAGLAAALWGQGRNEAAFEQARSAQRLADRARRNALDQLSERQMLAYDDKQADATGLAVAMAAESRDPALAASAWQLVMDGGGLVTRTMAARIAAAAARRSDAALWEEWRTTNAALSAARVAATKSPSPSAVATVDRAQEALDRVERRIAGLDGDAGKALVAERGDLRAALDALPVSGAMVRYVEVDDYAPDRYRRGPAGAAARLYALVGDRSRPSRIVALGTAREASEKAAAWYALASDPRGTPDRTAAAAKALRRLLLDPLALDTRIDRLMVVPSPALGHVGFAALLTEDDRYLAETGPTFHLLNHERDVLLPRAGGRTESLLLAGAADSGRPAAASGPAPVMRKACPGIGADRLGPLPGAANEIAALRELASGRAEPIDVLSGADATEAAVREAMSGHSIVHLATHAFAFGERCAGNDALRSIALDLPPVDGRPVDLSALPGLSALAFLPQSLDGAAHDGLLTSEEVATLDLSGVDWVVLSACETALGSDRGGEGVFGLRRAFRLAGARTVVMSLWKVEDEATAEFMRELYRARLLDRLDTPAAMQAAMRSTLEARRRRGASTHPLYWAGFAAAGAWR